MTAVDIVAWGSRSVSGLTEPEVHALAACAVIDVSPGWEPGTWQLRAGAHVGVLRAGDIEIRISPRISIARLIYLLGFAQDPKIWTEDPVGLDNLSDLWPAMAQVFLRQAENALERGVLMGYRTEESAQLVMRGRLREADQLRVRLGLAIPLEVRYDEYDTDIAENRILRAAAERMVAVPGVPPLLRRRLRHLNGRLADVSRLVPGQRLPTVTPSRLNQRYQPALALARMILTARSIDISNSRVKASGFLINMNTAFEDFVTVALTRALAPFGGRCKPQDANHPMDTARQIVMRPDLVRYGAGGLPQAVIDAKYKAEAPSGFPFADLYQLLAYCTAMKVKVGHLVYAEGSGAEQDVVVRNTGVTIRRHVLDLQQPVTDLQAQVAEIARVIASA